MHNVKVDAQRNIQSKFGEITIDLTKQINFPQGILGFPDFKSYCVVPCPVAKFSNFVLLQSTSNDELVFMTLPLDQVSQRYIKAEDLQEGCKQANIDPANLLLLLVAGTKVLESGQKVITVNAKAPIFMDITAKIAMQVVFQSTEYDVQQVL